MPRLDVAVLKVCTYQFRDRCPCYQPSGATVVYVGPSRCTIVAVRLPWTQHFASSPTGAAHVPGGGPGVVLGVKLGDESAPAAAFHAV